MFYFIGVSKTKQLINKDFICNVDIEGYQMYSQPSKPTSGGVAIYVNNELGHLKKMICLLLRIMLNHYGFKYKIIKVKILCVVVFIGIQTEILIIFLNILKTFFPR